MEQHKHTVLAAAHARLVAAMPGLQMRHVDRICQRSLNGGDTNEMYKTLFADIDVLKSMLVAIGANNLDALKMMIRYLDYLGCVADAWKLRTQTKRKFPEWSSNIMMPNLVSLFAHRVLPLFLLTCASICTGRVFLFDNTECANCCAVPRQKHNLHGIMLGAFRAQTSQQS
jgi:hypothetical protein